VGQRAGPARGPVHDRLEQIAASFDREDLIIYTQPEDFRKFLFEQTFDNSSLLLMSSGNYGGLDFAALKPLFE
jgi:UDP-N-acetylmuramate: L-alanyl-gamma-D-glutamyl-meso-diaminopimelate ligase